MVLRNSLILLRARDIICDGFCHLFRRLFRTRKKPVVVDVKKAAGKENKACFFCFGCRGFNQL